MSVVSSTIANIYDGVSQQPPTLRSVSQCELQENCISSLVDGVGKRPPTNHVTSISWDTWVAGGDNVFVHWINKNLNERYIAFIKSGSVATYDLADGTDTNGTLTSTAYLGASDPRTGYKAITIADYTIVINKDQVTAMGAASAPGSYGQKNTYADLPNPVNTSYYEVMGSGGGDFDNYFVLGNGSVWTEVVRPGLYNAFDASTMPHALIRQSDATFDFEALTWDVRNVGDDDTNPIPSFIGEAITSGFFYKNRLGFIANQQTVMSVNGEFFDFWRDTARAVLDSDPIDVSSSNPKASSVDHAVAMDESLLLFSQETQLILSGGDTLTPKNVSIDVSTQFQLNTLCEPTASGSNVYFATNNGQYTGIREYFLNSDINTRDAADITAHVPDYISGNAHKIIPATNQDMLFILTRDEPNIIYVYKYYWAGDDKLQSSWSKWVLQEGCVIHSAAVMDSKLYLAIEYQQGSGGNSTMSIEYIELQGGQEDGDLGFVVHLDRKVNLTSGSYDSGTDTTTWTVPYTLSTTPQACLGSTAGNDAGKALTLTSGGAGDTEITALGDWSSVDIYVGSQYLKKYRMSPQYVRGENKAVRDGRLQLKDVTIDYVNSGSFKAIVTPEGRDATEYEFTAKTLGDSNLILGSPIMSSGNFRFPIQSNARTTVIEFQNDSFLPSRFQSIHWIGWFYPRARSTV